MLELRDVHAGYGHTEILHGVTLSVAAGTVTALLGRNGMGKTTTIRSIVGTVPTSAGSITLAGTELVGMDIHRRARLGIGFVPETRDVFPSLTVTEHLRIASRRGTDGSDAWPLERLVEIFPVLARRASARGGQLSGGEQQILVIARALATNPTLLLLDEPTEGLAPSIVDEIGAILRRLTEEANAPAILLVEQNLDFALGLADRAYAIVSGRVAYDGDAATLRADTDLQHRLIGLGVP